MKQKIFWCLATAPYLYMFGIIAGVEWIYRLLLFYGTFMVITSCYVWWKEYLYWERKQGEKNETTKN